jgi:hypothetical protein
MARGGRRPGAGRRPGQLNKRTVEAVKFIGPVGERAIGVLVSAMEDPSALPTPNAPLRRDRAGLPSLAQARRRPRPQAAAAAAGEAADDAGWPYSLASS